jgi:16S rRNA (guanine(966)-N(2))-methyltransferase RsmD
MRIVGGALRGRKLASFKHPSIRPTADRVRESVFNILARCFPAEAVLDLFAGTGAMGIEAISRGAGRAVFVDAGQAAIAALEKNISSLGVAEQATILKLDAMSALKDLSRDGASFDVIFIDPPYAAGLYEETLEAIDGSGGVLKPGGLVVVETSKREALDLTLKALVKIDERRYGDTMIHIFRRS